MLKVHIKQQYISHTPKPIPRRKQGKKTFASFKLE